MRQSIATIQAAFEQASCPVAPFDWSTAFSWGYPPDGDRAHAKRGIDYRVRIAADEHRARATRLREDRDDMAQSRGVDGTSCDNGRKQRKARETDERPSKER